MARYFRYKSSQDVVEDAARLGLGIEMSEDFSCLFEPVTFGTLTAGNRLAIQPMEGCDGTAEGHPDELTYRRYRRFGTGGSKLIWAEATAISEAGRMNPRQLWINENTVGAIAEMLAGCRTAHRDAFGDDADLVVGLQLTHSGRFSYRKPLIAVHDPLLDPRTVDKSSGNTLDDSYPLLSDDALRGIADEYVAAARLAAQAGADFIDIKQCHRYLLSELLASKERPGEYGGSFENRTRLVRDVLRRIRDEVPGLTLASRFNAYDGIPYVQRGAERTGVPCSHEFPLSAAFGVNPENHLEEDLSEPIELARRLREWGVDLLNVSAGNPYANPHVVRPAEFAPVDGYDAPEHPLIGVCRQFRVAREIQRAVPETPVIGSAYSWLQDFAMQAAAANVAQGHVAIAGLGRATLSQPDFVQQLQTHGKLDRKQVCRTFSYCTNLMRTKDHPLGQYATGCPPFDKQVYGPLWKEAEAKLHKREEKT